MPDYSDKFHSLTKEYTNAQIEFPNLKEITLAQWMLESGRGSSKLAALYNNFGGLKWRPEMKGFATPIQYEAHDGPDTYCAFASEKDFITGYWHFLTRSPYAGWRATAADDEAFIRFIGRIYAPSAAAYAENVANLKAEAHQLLSSSGSPAPPPSHPVSSLNMEVNLIPRGRHNRPGSSNTREFITIHNTDNPHSGADARAHANFLNHTGYYIHNGETIYVSWHFTVDDHRVINHLPIEELGYHARNNGNHRSIGIEVCMNHGINQEAAFARAAKLTATLLHQLNKSVNSVVPHHYWTQKNCPSLLMQNGRPGRRWQDFKDQISRELASIAGHDPSAADDGAPGEPDGGDLSQNDFPVHN